MDTKKHKKSSELLMEIDTNKKLKKQISFHEIMEILKESSFGIALLIFALPSTLPFSIIPGFSFIMSIPLLIFGLQMACGYKKIQMPKFLTNHKISHVNLSKIIKKTQPFLKALEKPLKPRFSIMLTVIPTSITGIFITLLSFLVLLPIPLTNSFFAFFIVIYALALSEKDGLVILINWFITMIILFLVIRLIRYIL